MTLVAAPVAPSVAVAVTVRAVPVAARVTVGPALPPVDVGPGIDGPATRILSAQAAPPPPAQATKHGIAEEPDRNEVGKDADRRVQPLGLIDCKMQGAGG